jgi:hypothetical protein
MNEPLVAAGILPAVEGGILPPGSSVNSRDAWSVPAALVCETFFRRAGKPGATTGRDACCYKLLTYD